jgi:hypothetical protein
MFGVTVRLGSSRSSTFVKLIAASGTVYTAGVQGFTSQSGTTFTLVETITIGDNGYGYGKIQSVDVGLKTNVKANTVITVSPAPVGHIAVTNEYMATGGRDAESDEDFRIRIKSHFDSIAQKTLPFLTNICIGINSDVLRLIHLGIDETTGKLMLGVVTQNGIDLSTPELEALRDGVAPYLSLTDLNFVGENISVDFQNLTWLYVNDTTGIDFRVDLVGGYDADVVRENIQIAISKYLDLRYWDYNKRVEWDTLLSIVKSVEGVKYVPDQFFNPSEDIAVPYNKLPRVKVFVMRDMAGSIIADNNGVLSPVFYPSI